MGVDNFFEPPLTGCGICSVLRADLDAAHRDLRTLQERFRASQAKANEYGHEVERLRATLARPQPERIWPVHIRCDGKGCLSVVAFDPAPDEGQIAKALIDLGWCLGNGSYHLCPRCP